MRLTTKSEYSLLLMIYLARQNEGSFVTLDEICSHYCIPQKYVEQLATTLKQGRLVRARRGIAGGYALAQPASQISLASIVRLMDGPIAPTESVSENFYTRTPIEKEKKALGFFRDIRGYLANKMEATMLADLV